LDNRSGVTTDADSDSVSTASGSNVLKPNGAEEDNISDVWGSVSLSFKL